MSSNHPHLTNGRGRTASGKPNPVDVHVGSRVRLRRTLLGMSQETLGFKLALTFQQVQKYERGANRVGASRLFDIARVLDVPVQFFFDAMPDDVAAMTPSLMDKDSADKAYPCTAEDPMQQRETLELVRSYHSITNPTMRTLAYETVKTLAKSSAPAMAAE
ncbi:MAG: helix-turn-helix transcriptional regulator [Rhodospirillaceae bacterium]|nr:helix-turn-helix transcriptional regulator [Rhodospirillales bacterium]